MATQLEQETDGRAAPSAAARVAAPTRAARPARRPIVLGLLVVVLLAALAWGWRKWSYARAHETTDNAQVDGHVLPVLAKVGGYVRALPVEENQPVRAGQPLADIDDADYRLRLAQAEAELQAAQAAVGGGDAPGQAQAAVSAASEQRSVLEAQIEAARVAVTRTQADLGRARELAAKQIVSRQQLDAAQAAADQAAANLRAVQRQAEAAGSAISQARAGVRLAEARLEAARAARDNAALQLSYTHVAAPAAGTVARRQVEPGQLVQPGQPLLSIVADSGMWVTANFKETQLADIRTGAAAEIEVDAYPGCTAHGTVESIGSATGARFALLPPDNATGNFTKVVQRIPVRLHVTEGCGADHPLRPGMSTSVSVVTR
jgi:membrane fusion protein, multidrug efflux system